MAIRMKITLASGIEIDDAYLKITNISGNKNNICIVLTAYKDASSMQNGLPQIEGYSLVKEFVPTLGSSVSDFISQGYNHLKTLPDFSGALDILEEGQTI